MERRFRGIAAHAAEPKAQSMEIRGTGTIMPARERRKRERRDRQGPVEICVYDRDKKIYALSGFLRGRNPVSWL